MVFERVDESGKSYLVLKKDESFVVDSVALGMLNNNSIKGVLPFHFIQIDNIQEFRYEITGLVDLGSFFAGGAKKKNVVEFLKAVARICDVCEKYMVDLSQIEMEPKYIFTDGGSSISFVLVPLSGLESNFNDKLKNYVMGLAFDRSEDSSYVTDILGYFQKHSTFSIKDFSEMIRTIENPVVPMAPISSPMAEAPVEQAVPGGQMSGAISGQGQTQQGQMDLNMGAVPPAQSFGGMAIPGASGGMAIPGVPGGMAVPGATDPQEKKKGFLFFGKKDKPEKVKKEKPVKEKKEKVKKEKPVKEKKEKKNKKTAPSFGGIAIPGIEDGGNSAGNVIIPQQMDNIKAKSIELEQHAVEKVDFGHTEFAPMQETPVPAQVQPAPVQPVASAPAMTMEKYSLVWTAKGQKYEINKETTRIGRKYAVVDICIDNNPHVGRLHAIIHRDGNNIFIEDNASSNGTFLNGEDIRGKGRVALRKGDKIELGDESLAIE